MSQSHSTKNVLQTHKKVWKRSAIKPLQKKDYNLFFDILYTQQTRKKIFQNSEFGVDNMREIFEHTSTNAMDFFNAKRVFEWSCEQFNKQDCEKISKIWKYLLNKYYPKIFKNIKKFDHKL